MININTLYYFGICVVVWLTVGAIVATRLTFFNGMYTEEQIKIRKKRIEAVDGNPELADKKWFGFLGITLLGFYSFYRDTKTTFKRRKK